MTLRATLQITGTLALLAFLSAGCAGSGPVLPGGAMARILAHHQTGPHDLEVKGLQIDPGFQAPEKPEEAGYEVHCVPYPPGHADYFAYRVLLHPATGRYWIHISGGFAGTSRFFGPGKVEDLRK